MLEINDLIKELDKKLIVTKTEIIDGIMYIYCDTKKQKTKCKYLRTKRLDNYINRIGLKTSSKDAEKQIKDTHVTISNNTILRIIKKNKN